jgi:hypothetical protein
MIGISILTSSLPQILEKLMVDNIFSLGLLLSSLCILVHSVIQRLIVFESISFGTHYVIFYFSSFAILMEML